MASMPCPAEEMEGEQLADDWTVAQKLIPSPGATGGNFSVGYLVEHPNHGQAFMKALDFSRALQAPDPTVMLQAQTEAYNYECRILDKCANERLDRVVVALAKGSHAFPGQIIPVPYLIFERADRDVRAHLDAAANFDAAWAMRTLQQIAIGLHQLHSHQIAHQDMKPSNVLMFGTNESKIGDVGRSDYQGHTAPHAGLPFAGDPQYAPPELLYGHIDPSWSVRRKSCDLYHLGSLALYFFADASTTPALFSKLDQQYQPAPGGPDYPTALPFVRDAFSEVVDDLDACLTGDDKDQLVLAFRELCDPDPAHRGHPKARIGVGNPYALDRYVSRFDLLARRAGMGRLGATRR